MRKNSLLAIGLSALLILTGAGIADAKENPKANANAKENSSAKEKSTPAPQTKEPAKAPAAANNSEAAKSGNQPAPQSNSQSPQSNSQTSPSVSASTSNNVVGKSAATPSKNAKLDPAKNPTAETNQKADSARAVASRATAACSPSRSTKNVDPCSDFIVVFNPGFSRTNSNELLRQSSAQVKRTFSSIFNGALVNGPLSKMQALANNPNVLVVEDDLEVSTFAVQKPAPWGLDRIDQRLLPLSNSFDDKDLGGLNTYSYVVDTGIDATNVDFEKRVAPGFTAILDGRGSADCNGHGTHVAGTIAGKQYGVAKASTLIPVRVLDCTGSGSYSTVISGLDWIAANHRAGDAAVVNMSLGGSASSTLDGAVKNLITKGIHVVVAAGNSNADACNYSPARVPDAITVGATTSADARASYSNTGSCLDLFAPGSLITSAWLGTTSTQTISGTSMAAPHAAGVVARFIALNSTLSPAQVAQSLRSSATPNTISSVGSSSPNRLLFSDVVIDLTAPVVDSSPTFKKVNPRGKGSSKG
jgi:subtilisin family serine protease